MIKAIKIVLLWITMISIVIQIGSTGCLIEEPFLLILWALLNATLYYICKMFISKEEFYKYTLYDWYSKFVQDND